MSFFINMCLSCCCQVAREPSATIATHSIHSPHSNPEGCCFAVLSSTSVVNTHGRARSIQDEIEDLHLTRSVEGTSSRTASLGSEKSNALSVDEGGDEKRMGQGGE